MAKAALNFFPRLQLATPKSNQFQFLLSYQFDYFWKINTLTRYESEKNEFAVETPI